MSSDFRNEMPAGDVQIGPREFIRIYGFSDIAPPLVEWRHHDRRGPVVINLTISQARAIAAGLVAAADKASGGNPVAI